MLERPPRNGLRLGICPDRAYTIRVARKRHWVNSESARLVFCTTTVLDFAHVFADFRLRSLMAASLLSDLRHYGATLHAYVVMSHHVHFVAHLPEDLTMSKLMDRVKSNAARRIMPRLSARQKALLLEQTGLNCRTFWQRSFRGIAIGAKGFSRAVNYVHFNPVKAEVVATEEEYHWSSARWWANCLWNDETGIEVTDQMICEFCDLSDLKIKGRR